MMNPWLSVSDLCERWNCCAATARARIRQMIHMEIRPLKVRESVVNEWENARLTGPGLESAPRRKKRPSKWQEPPKDANGNYYIPRRGA